MSDIWERKIRTFFRRFDLDKDGTLHRAEFVALGEGIGDKEKFDPKQKEIVKKCFDDVSIPLSRPTHNLQSPKAKCFSNNK